MRINIAGWSCRGLRCPDVDVDLREPDGTPFHVAFLQMPNGTGKTTTLDLLKAALSGEAERWSDTRIRGLRRRDATNAAGHFKVRLLVDGKPLTFELDFDFENGRITCVTTRPGSGGMIKRWAPPLEMRRFLAPKFLDLFVFNGELARKLFEEETSAEEAINALCQLYLLTEVSADVHNRWQARAALAAGPKTGPALAALQTKRAELGARKIALQRSRETALKDMATAKAASEALEVKIRANRSGRQQDDTDLSDARTAEATANARVKEAVSSLHQRMKLPLALNRAIGASLTNWKDHLEDLKLPEATSEVFFTDLLKRDDCICGTPMTDVMREQIDAQSKLVLSSDENGQLNIIKRDIERYEQPSGDPSHSDETKLKLTELSAARREQLECQQTVRALRNKIIQAGGDQVKAWVAQQTEHDKQYEQCEAMVASIDDPGLHLRPNDTVFSLAKIQRDIDDTDAKITDATDTVKLRDKTTLVQKILERTEELARRRIKAELLEACNARLGAILANDPIELEAIDGHLKLAGQEMGSEAQMLSVGYTFLMTLLERGDNRFPLLVDSPVGKMDGSVRRRVGKLIPDLCSQFVTFVINTELAEFAPAVEKEARSVLHLTFFRKTEGTTRLMANLPAGHFVETDDGVLVNDEGYFDTFDIEEEEEA